MRNRLSFLITLTLFGTMASAQLEVKAVRIPAPPTIDGTVDDAEWKDVASFEGLVDAATNSPSPEGGKFWLAYDSKFIYFAARLDDHSPEQIKATEYRTNTNFPGDDYVNLLIDPQGNGTDFNVFGINPKGATSIALAGGRAAKREWSGEFVAKARITSAGWECEARIPWRIMPLPKVGKKDVRFNIARFLQRTYREYDYGFVGNMNQGNAPKWSGVEIPAAPPERILKLLPYTYSGYGKDEGVILNGGMDFKLPVTPTITAVGSIEPDFRNIENQILSLDFSRFTRIANESRPFFVEGYNYLGSIIYTSQFMPKFDVGLNTYGKIGDKGTFGLIETNTFGKENDIAGKFVQKPDAGSDWGFGFTSKKEKGYNSDAQFVRAQKTWGPLVAAVRHAQSQDSFFGRGVSDILALVYNKNEFFAQTNLRNASPNFTTALGFTPEVDYKGGDLVLNYDKPFKDGPLRESITTLYGLEYKHYGGGFYRNEYNINQEIAFKNNLDLTLAVDWQNFEGEKDKLYTGILTYPRGNPYNSVSVQMDSGTQALIPYDSKRIQFSKRFGKHLQTALSYQAVRYQNYSDQAIFTMNYDLGNDRSISGRIVKRNSKINPYIAYRRSGNKGTEFFVILGNPNTTQFHPSLVLKLTMPFELNLDRKRSA